MASRQNFGCLTMCNTIVILLLGLGMFIAGTVMWIVIDDYFGIVDVNYVICNKMHDLLYNFNPHTIYWKHVTIIVLICCFATNRHEFNSRLITC